MAHSWTVRTLAAILAFGLGGTWGSEISARHQTLDPHSQDNRTVMGGLSAEERALVDFAMDRFRSQGLAIPTVDFIFHESLWPCHGHMGLYHPNSDLLEMCTLDKHTILHELGHAWADENLSRAQMERFVVERNLDSWNDHEHDWERRGTEHVAETIAWALLEQPPHVKWVEPQDDGSFEVSYRILTLRIDVQRLIDNFQQICGRELVFRHPGEWRQAEPAPEISPELERSRRVEIGQPVEGGQARRPAERRHRPHTTASKRNGALPDIRHQPGSISAGTGHAVDRRAPAAERYVDSRPAGVPFPNAETGRSDGHRPRRMHCRHIGFHCHHAGCSADRS